MAELAAFQKAKVVLSFKGEEVKNEKKITYDRSFMGFYDFLPFPSPRWFPAPLLSVPRDDRVEDSGYPPGLFPGKPL